MRVPDAEVSATIALESADAVVEEESTSLVWLQANTVASIAAAHVLATTIPDLRVFVFVSFIMPRRTEARAIKFLGAPALE